MNNVAKAEFRKAVSEAWAEVVADGYEETFRALPLRQIASEFIAFDFDNSLTGFANAKANSCDGPDFEQLEKDIADVLVAILGADR